MTAIVKARRVENNWYRLLHREEARFCRPHTFTDMANRDPGVPSASSPFRVCLVRRSERRCMQVSGYANINGLGSGLACCCLELAQDWGFLRLAWLSSTHRRWLDVIRLPLFLCFPLWATRASIVARLVWTMALLAATSTVAGKTSELSGGGAQVATSQSAPVDSGWDPASGQYRPTSGSAGRGSLVWVVCNPLAPSLWAGLRTACTPSSVLAPLQPSSPEPASFGRARNTPPIVRTSAGWGLPNGSRAVARERDTG